MRKPEAQRIKRHKEHRKRMEDYFNRNNWIHYHLANDLECKAYCKVCVIQKNWR